MKRRGFTLAELLVALTIIAIAAAALGPMYIKMRPDKYKNRVMKYYNLIDQTTSKLITNQNLYYRSQDDGNASNYIPGTHILDPNTPYGCNGLACTEKPKVGTGYDNPNYQGFAKYPNLMAAELPFENTTQTATASIPTAKGTLADKSEWKITKLAENGVPVYNIMIDLDSSSDSPNCSYVEGSCGRPDQFVFRIDLNGDVSGQDPLTKAYIKNMTNTNKSVDFDEAANNQ